MNAALRALEAGTIDPAALCIELQTDRERLVEEIAAKNIKIGELERCLAIAADMITCLSNIREMPK